MRTRQTFVLTGESLQNDQGAAFPNMMLQRPPTQQEGYQLGAETPQDTLARLDKDRHYGSSFDKMFLCYFNLT